MLVALGHEYALPAGKPKVLAIADVLPLGETRLVTFRSLLLISDSMFSPFGLVGYFKSIDSLCYKECVSLVIVCTPWFKVV